MISLLIKATISIMIRRIVLACRIAIAVTMTKTSTAITAAAITATKLVRIVHIERFVGTRIATRAHEKTRRRRC